jgi:hypothetical protein
MCGLLAAGLSESHEAGTTSGPDMSAVLVGTQHTISGDHRKKDEMTSSTLMGKDE